MIHRLPLVLLALVLMHQPPSAAWAQTKSVDRTLDLDAGATLTLVSSKGSVRLVPWDRNQIEIHARIEAPDGVGSEYARQAVEATEVLIDGDRRTLRIAPDYDKVPYERGWLGSRSRTVPPIHFEIRAPARLDMRLDVDRTETRIGGFEGRIDIESDRGDLEAEGLTGVVSLEVDRGDRIRLTDVRGSVDVEADRSDVRIAFVQIDADSRVEIDRGDIELRIPASQGLDLRADIERRADFDSDLPVTVQGKVGDRLEGTINGGGPRLVIHSDRGRVRLRREGA